MDLPNGVSNGGTGTQNQAGSNTTTIPRRTLLTDSDPPLVAVDQYGEIFLSIVERTGVGLAVLDTRLRIRENNMAFVEQCGLPKSELPGRNLCELLHPSVRQHMVRQFDRLIQGRSTRFVERLAALWSARTSFTGTLTGAAVLGTTGRVDIIVVLVNPDRAEDDRRVLATPNRVLSEMNARILEGVACGVPTVQLANRLYLSRQGIEYHVTKMLRQFRVPNRAALVSKAYSMGMFGLGAWPPKVLDDYVGR